MHSTFSNSLLAFVGLIACIQLTTTAQSFPFHYSSTRGPATFEMQIYPAPGPKVEVKAQLRGVRDYLVDHYHHYYEKEWVEPNDPVASNPFTIFRANPLLLTVTGTQGPVTEFEAMSIFIGLEAYYRSYRQAGQAPSATFASTYRCNDPAGRITTARGNIFHGLAGGGDAAVTMGSNNSTGAASAAAAPNRKGGSITEIQTSRRSRLRRRGDGDVAVGFGASDGNSTHSAGRNMTSLGVPHPSDPFLYEDDFPRVVRMYEFSTPNVDLTDFQDMTMTCWGQTLQDWLLYGEQDKFNEYDRDGVECNNPDPRSLNEIYMVPSQDYDDKVLSWDVVIDAFVASWKLTRGYEDGGWRWMSSARMVITRDSAEVTDLVEFRGDGWIGLKRERPSSLRSFSASPSSPSSPPSSSA